jgi:CAI-1 autoinducer synthase
MHFSTAEMDRLAASPVVQDTSRHPKSDRELFDPQRLLPSLRRRFVGEFQTHWDTEWSGKCILHGSAARSEAIRLDGNDYLAVGGHPHIVGAQVDALRRDNSFVIQSGAFVLDEHPSRAFERRMATWLGKEDGFVCQSGYAANLGLLQAIADPETPVYLDTMAHMSLWEGARAARAPAYAFRHNDETHLAKMIARHGPGVVVVDSVYSTTGALCRLLPILKVVEQSNSMILVDESHSLGTHGPAGAGLCVALGVSDRVHFITASLAKAFAGRAGFFTVPASMRYYVLHNSFPNIFSSCLLHHEFAALDATLDVIQGSDAARARLHEITTRLRGAMSEMGYPIHQGTEQIIALEAGRERDTMAVRDQFEASGIFGAVFCAPATSRNRSMLRWTLNSALTDSELAHIVSVCEQLLPVVQPRDWPIARRGVSTGQALSA